MYFVLFTFMEDIDVIFVYICGGYRCNFLFTFMEDIDVFCFALHLWRISDVFCFALHLWRISDVFRFVYIYGGYLMYFVLFTFMEDTDVILFCLHLWRISM